MEEAGLWRTFSVSSFTGQFSKCPATCRPQTISSSISCYLWSIDSKEELSSFINSQGAERPDVLYSISLREARLFIQQHFICHKWFEMITFHFPPVDMDWLCWGRRLTKAKATQQSSGLSKKTLAANELLLVSTRHDVNTTSLSTNETIMARSPAGGEDAESVALTEASESVTSGIQLQVSHLLASDSGWVI